MSWATPMKPTCSPLGPQRGCDSERIHRHSLQPRIFQLRGDQLQPAHDRRQKIVEVVRDPAGKLADRLHLLRLAKRLLGAEPLAHLGLEPVERLG